MSKSDDGGNRILVVDDEPTISVICDRVLTGEGFTVDLAEDSEKAQNLIATNEYDLILLDIKMPGIDGEKMYKWMKSNYAKTINTVVFTTGSVMTTTVTDFIADTGRPFLPKPFTPIELTAIIRETLGMVWDD
jgi:DNA-binding response OmpR family regulator